ncbi:MAG: hypothetical protein IPI17_15930 [Nitrosomonas sp.]|nr:hypothetical protein [Nitrosomonas sp.]
MPPFPIAPGEGPYYRMSQRGWIWQSTGVGAPRYRSPPMKRVASPCWSLAMQKDRGL